MRGRQRALIVILRLGGVLTGSAVFTIFLPTSWMAATHEWLDLGEFPEAPITEYLTRSLSAFYAMHGAILLMLSTNVRRFAPVIQLLGWLSVGFGVLMTGIDLYAPMPMTWTLSEGPWIVLIGVVIVWLVRGIDRQTGDSA